MNYARGQHVAWREVGPETVVIHLATKRVFGLNATGGRVWQALEAEGTPEGLALRAGAGLSADDVEAFLCELAAEGLLGPRPGEAAPPAPLPARLAGDAVPPRILWRDQVTAFVGECTFNEGGGEGCESGVIANS